MKFILGVFITIMVLLYSTPNQACLPGPNPFPSTDAPTTTEKPPPPEGTQPPPRGTRQPPQEETPLPDGTLPPTRGTRRSTPKGTTQPLPETQPPQATIPTTTFPFRCPDILPTDSSDGMAPLYGNISDGNRSYIVVLNDGVDPDEMIIEISNLTSLNATAMEAIKSSYSINAVVLEFDDNEQLNMVRHMEGVKYVEKNGIVTTTQITGEMNLDRIDQRRLPLDFQFSPNGNGKDSTVYVLDTGVKTDHEAFGGRAENWHEVVKVPGKPEDCNGHGTHVAGTVGAMTYGVATAVKIRSVRVFGCDRITSVCAILKGIKYVGENAPKTRAVVLMSLAAKTAAVSVDEAVSDLIKAGFIVVVAAGNAKPRKLPVDVCEVSPARVPEAITVGAVDAVDKRAPFSNFGAGVDIFAPGVLVDSLDYNSKNGTRLLSGTSQAAPHVAGAAAILLSLGTPSKDVPKKIFDTSTKNVVGDPKGANNRLLFVG